MYDSSISTISWLLRTTAWCRARRLSRSRTEAFAFFLYKQFTDHHPSTSDLKLCHNSINLANFTHLPDNISNFYPRDAMLARVIEIATCLSVCLSVTRQYCVKTKKATGMISSPSVSPKTLVFRRQISSPNSKCFPPNGGLKQGSVGKIQRFSSFKRQYLENRSRYGQSYY